LTISGDYEHQSVNRNLTRLLCTLNTIAARFIDRSGTPLLLRRAL